MGGPRNGSDFCWLPIIDDSYREIILYNPHKPKKTKDMNHEERVELDKVKKDRLIKIQMEKEGHNIRILD